MKCKPDQICRIIGGAFLENKNRLVRTIEKSGSYMGTPEWRCEALQPIKTFGKGLVPAGEDIYALDTTLEPLHDGDGADETLEWKDVPQPVKERTYG